MKKIFFLVFVLLVLGCKNKNDEANKLLTPEEKINAYLTVTVRAKVQEDDKFQLYFSEEIISQYHPEDIVEVNVKASDNYQNIDFILPERIYPIKLRIDLGVENLETPVYIDEIVFSTGPNKKVFRGSELLEHFKPNKFVELDEATLSFKRKIVEGIYDPFIISINIDDIVSSLFRR